MPRNTPSRSVAGSMKPRSGRQRHDRLAVEPPRTRARIPAPFRPCELLLVDRDALGQPSRNAVLDSCSVMTCASSCQSAACQLNVPGGRARGESSVTTRPKQAPSAPIMPGRPTLRTAKSSWRGKISIRIGPHRRVVPRGECVERLAPPAASHVRQSPAPRPDGAAAMTSRLGGLERSRLSSSPAGCTRRRRRIALERAIEQRSRGRSSPVRSSRAEIGGARTLPGRGAAPCDSASRRRRTGNGCAACAPTTRYTSPKCGLIASTCDVRVEIGGAILEIRHRRLQRPRLEARRVHRRARSSRPQRASVRVVFVERQFGREHVSVNEVRIEPEDARHDVARHRGIGVDRNACQTQVCRRERPVDLHRLAE